MNTNLPSPKFTTEETRNLLRRLYDFHWLSKHPLAHSNMVTNSIKKEKKPFNAAARGSALSAILDSVIENYCDHDSDQNQEACRIQECLKMAYRDNLTGKEIATNLGISHVTVARYNTKACEKITLILQEMESDAKIILSEHLDRCFLPRRSILIGREKKIETIMSILNPEDRHWIINIDGIGGVGKTALAIEAAYRAIDSGYFDIVIWTTAKKLSLYSVKSQLENPSLSTFSDLLDEIGINLNLAVSKFNEEEKQKIILDHLRKQSENCLIVIDNLETISLEHQKKILTFLNKLPGHNKGIITTREQFAFHEMFLLRLGGLSLDDAREYINRECYGLDIQISSDEVDSLVKVTGGIPLAMNWVLAVMKEESRPLKLILDQLSFPELKSIKNYEPIELFEYCFRGAYQKLEINEKKLLAAALVFVSSIPREILQIISSLPEMAFTGAVHRSVKLAFMNQDGNDKFILHPTTRAFLANELGKESFLPNDTHYFQAIEYYKKYLNSQNLTRYYGRCEEERQNLRALFTWCELHQEWGKITELFNIIEQFLEMKGYWSEYREYSQLAIGAYSKLGDLEQLCWYKILYQWVNINQDKASTEAELRILLDEAEKQNWPGCKALALCGLGTIEKDNRHLDQAREYWVESLEIWNKLDNKKWIAITCGKLGTIYLRSNQFDEARQSYLRALAIHVDLGDEAQQAILYGKLARFETQVGNLSKATEYLNTSEQICIKAKDKRGLAFAKWRKACILRSTAVDSALVFAKQAREFFMQIIERPREKELDKLILELEEELEKQRDKI
jgi:tetratricopeptide (TPR) repeat protein